MRSLLKWFDQYDYKNIRIWAGPIPYVFLMETKYVEVSTDSIVCQISIYIYVQYTLSACAEQHNVDLQVRPIQLALSVAGQRPPYGQRSSVDAAA